ncbi:MAG: S1 RNA-binding domain-containing protein [Planctomycetaceae bacterium]|nr:S1 RNA-binding domain-containing protein [Planctomycetaceae bacterium]
MNGDENRQDSSVEPVVSESIPEVTAQHSISEEQSAGPGGQDDGTGSAPVDSGAEVPVLAEPALEAPPEIRSESPAETVAATPAPANGEAPAGEAVPEPEAPRRKIQLNPTSTDQSLAAVPSLGPGTSTASLTPSAGPVDLPPRQTQLDQGLEDEINAAMSGAMVAPVARPEAPSDGTPSPSTLASELPTSEEQLTGGMRLKAKVQSVTAEDVFCDVGYRAPGVVPVRQFPQGKQPREGEEFLVIVDKYDSENGVIHVSLPKATRKAKGGWDELQIGQIVDCYVNRTNKGGLEVTIANLRGFLPASQVDVGFVASLDTYVGQKFPVQVTEVNPAKRNLVVSRKAIVIQERKEAAAVFWQKAEVGQQYNGRVKTVKDYGAFVDIGGVDGFLHVGEMSWTRIRHPSEVVQEGQTVDVIVLSLDRDQEKIGLGMRQLAQNPWAEAVDKYAVGRNVTGKVTRATDFGAFIELEPGVEGLVHISELDHRRVRKVTDVLAVGQEVQVQVLEVAPDRQRISLSLKALKEKPEEPKDEDLSPGKGQQYDRKRKEPLRGGTSGSAGSSGLFGDPNAYR